MKLRQVFACRLFGHRWEVVSQYGTRSYTVLLQNCEACGTTRMKQQPRAKVLP